MFNTALAHWCTTTAFYCHISDVRAATASLYSSCPLSEFCMRSSTELNTCFAGNSGSGLASMSLKSVRSSGKDIHPAKILGNYPKITWIHKIEEYKGSCLPILHNTSCRPKNAWEEVNISQVIACNKNNNKHTSYWMEWRSSTSWILGWNIEWLLTEINTSVALYL